MGKQGFNFTSASVALMKLRLATEITYTEHRLEQVAAEVFRSESAWLIHPRAGRLWWADVQIFMWKWSCPPDSCLSPTTYWSLLAGSYMKQKESSTKLVLTVCDSRSFIWANLEVSSFLRSYLVAVYGNTSCPYFANRLHSNSVFCNLEKLYLQWQSRQRNWTITEGCSLSFRLFSG